MMKSLSLLLPFVSAFALVAPAAAATLDVGTAAPIAAGLLTPAEKATYRTAFAAIRGGDYAGAATALDGVPNGVLTPVARAELYLAGGVADPAALTALLQVAPELPQAPALARLARERGALAVPLLPAEHDLVRYAAPSKRLPARPTRADAASAALGQQLQPLFKVNDAASAEPLVEEAAARLSPEALTEWRQKLAWTYLLANDDADAKRVAAQARTGAGEWAVQADWVFGLAAWRSNEMDAAAEAFSSVASRARDPEMMAAGLYWAARSDTAGGHPERIEARLRTAARLGETFYGMLAGGILGIAEPPSLTPEPTMQTANARAAAALVEIGETALADRLLRRQARIGDPARHANLIALATRLDLPATQVWLAQNGPSGLATTIANRYPVPAWAPTGGWRVDRALCLAHALQESQFRLDAVSRAGARGLMQLMPGTARLVARHKGDAAGADRPLDDPAVSFEYGQSYLEELAGTAATGGLLPKVIAAYNAGPNNVGAWAQRPGASQDPLFFIETIPFAETRTYVATVLRNYWIYQRATGAATESLAALAEGRWPRFPASRATARVAYSPPSTSAVAN